MYMHKNLVTDMSTKVTDMDMVIYTVCSVRGELGTVIPRCLRVGECTVTEVMLSTEEPT